MKKKEYAKKHTPAKKPKYADYANLVLSVFDEIPERYWGKVLYLVTQYISHYVTDRKSSHFLIDGQVYSIKRKGKQKLTPIF